MNVGFIRNGNNVKTGHKNNNNACVRDMQIEHPAILILVIMSTVIVHDQLPDRTTNGKRHPAKHQPPSLMTLCQTVVATESR
jgi:hypothetical protein